MFVEAIEWVTQRPTGTLRGRAVQGPWLREVAEHQFGVQRELHTKSAQPLNFPSFAWRPAETVSRFRLISEL